MQSLFLDDEMRFLIFETKQLPKWFRNVEKVLEGRKGYCDLDLYYVERQDIDRVRQFCDVKGYHYKQVADRFFIYNFKNLKVQARHPEVFSDYLGIPS